MASLNISLLGGLRLEQDGKLQRVSSPRLQALIAFLLLHRDRPHSRAHLAYLLWPDSSESQARTNLRQILHNLRRALPEAGRYLTLEGQDLQWQQDAPATLDIAQFEEALACAQQAETAEARQCLEQAIALYCGDLLPDLYDDWLEPERERLRGLFAQGLERLVALLEAQGDYSSALPYAQRLVAHDSLQEAPYRQLMRLYALLGERGKALRVYHGCASTLERELALAPSPETRALYEKVLQAEIAPQPATPASPVVPRARPAFVGRQPEWASLLELWQAAQVSGPHMVFVSGDSGIGKTRLVQELARAVRQGGETTIVVRCYAAEGAPAFAPVTALLRTAVIQRFLPNLAAVWQGELVRLLPEFARPEVPAPAPLHEPWQRQRIFEALARAVFSTTPLLLVIDDLQWCDRDTLEWLHFLLRFDARARLLVIATARKHEIGDNPALGELLTALKRDDLVHELELAPLSEDESAKLAQHLNENRLEPEALGRIYRASEGNPLFIVEMLRGGSYGGEDSQLPPKLQAVIASRLGRLSPEAQALAALAAVIGREFSFELLVKVSHQDEESLIAQLDELWRQRVVREKRSGSYDFSHDKFREVAYESLSQTRKGLLHRHIAEALETLHASHLDSVSGEVASHYDQANNPERAIPYYQRAAEAAKRLYANEEAIRHYKRALELVASLPDHDSSRQWRQRVSAQLQEGLADVYKLVGRPEEAKAFYEKALTNLPERVPLRQAKLWRKIGSVLAAQYRFDETAAAYREGEAALGPEPTSGAEAWWQEWLDMQFGFLGLHYWLLQWDEMDKLLKRVEPFVNEHGTALQRSKLYFEFYSLGLIHDRLATSETTLLNVRGALAAIQPIQEEHVAQAAMYRFGYSFALLWAGQLAEAEAELKSVLTAAERIGDRTLKTRCLSYLAFLHRKRRNERRTAYYACKSLELSNDLHMPTYTGAARGHFAWLFWLKGDLDAATREGLAALELWSPERPYPIAWSALLPLLAVAYQQADHENAVTYAKALLEPRQQRLPDELTEALEATVKAAEEGGLQRVREHLERSVALAKAENFL